MARNLLAAFAAAGLALAAAPALASGDAKHPKHVDWTWDGPFGTFDQAQLQRGYKVYREVCASGHSMDLMYFRNLGQPGGPFYDEHYPNRTTTDRQTIAATTGGRHRRYDRRPGAAAGHLGRPFPAPFPNEPAARAANGGALPPDLSVIAKARHGGGPTSIR